MMHELRSIPLAVWKVLYCVIAASSILPHSLFCSEELVEEVIAKGINVHLREPEYCEGVLKTEKGGVVSGPDMRIQAQKIIYIRKPHDGGPVHRIEAEGDLILEFNDYFFVGSRLEYDFETKTGVIYDGRTASEPWFFGGESIILCSDGSYIIYHGYLTTSESLEPDWEISAAKATISSNHDLKASDVQFKYVKLPFFWLPSFNVNLDYIFDTPIRYRFRWGGKQGPRAVMIYEFLSMYRWKAFLRLDYRLTRGPGIGFETYYRSEDHKENFESINYIARDSSLIHPSQTIRYRFQGQYTNLVYDDKVSINLTYDKLSDKDMATDYDDNSLDLEIAGQTQLEIRRQDYDWIANFFSIVRVNNFQTIRQELPTIETSWRPQEIASTGIITDRSIRASYLDFVYANDVADAHDYHSPRFEYTQRFYRPIHCGPVTITPDIGGLAIYYGNTPRKNHRWLTLGDFKMEANTHFYRYFLDCKHVITPYTRYNYITFPTSSPGQHYIFDIDDGWYRLNMLTCGFRNNFYIKDGCGLVHRYMLADIFANAFFDTPTIPTTVQKLYGYFVLFTTPCLRHTFDTAYDFQHRRLDHFNVRLDWTISPDFAVAAEFRHRDAFDWRKVDHTNFILDSYRSTEELLHSQLSDRRDTFLIDLFYRFDPNWAVEILARHGWMRKHEPEYTEYEIDLHGTLRSAWHIKLSYQRKENDHHRVAIYFTVGLARPDDWKCSHFVPSCEF